MPDLPCVVALTIRVEFINEIAYGHSTQIPTRFSIMHTHTMAAENLDKLL